MTKLMMTTKLMTTNYPLELLKEALSISHDLLFGL